TLPKHEIAAPLVEHRNTENIARQQIAGELNTTKFAAHRLGDRTCERRLADTGNVLDENMASSQKGDQRELDCVRLAFQGLLYSAAQTRDGRRGLSRDGDGGCHRSTS